MCQFSGGKLAAAAAAVAAAAAATGQVVPTSLSMQTMPIIPMARTQLEELVKNLDAELVLDVVSKKMFDNFSMWDLQVCSIIFFLTTLYLPTLLARSRALLAPRAK